MTLLFSKKNIALLTLLFMQVVTFAQTSSDQPVEMAETLYQSGKIYVVIIAIVLIFIGIIVYLVLIDRKLGKLEKELKKD